MATIAASFIAIVVLLALQILRLSSLIISQDLEFSIIAKMMFGLSLSFTPMVIPIAFLFALLIVFGRMSTEREFVAMQAMGRSPVSLSKPCLIFGVVMVLGSLVFSFDSGPRGNRMFESSIDQAFKKKVASVLRSGTFSEGFLNMVLFVDKVDPVTQELERVFIHDEKSFQDEVSISAKTGQWLPSDQDDFGVLKLKEGVILSQDLSKEIVRRVFFDEYRLNADFSKQQGKSRDSPPSLGWKRLFEKRSEILAQNPDERDGREIFIEIARRIAVSCVCFFFVPLCFALSLDNSRTAKSRAVFSGLLIVGIYWTLYFLMVSIILGSSQKIFRAQEWPIWLLIWVPNFCVMALGTYLMKLKSRLH